MKIIAAGLFILFPVLFLIPSFGTVDLDEITTANQVYSYINVKTNTISLVLPFVYIGMGIFSMKKQRGSVYGDE